jgi:hypothetical protein
MFDGGGWSFPYLLGIGEHLQRNESRGRLADLGIDLRYVGVSSGACVALAAALDVPMADVMRESVAWAPVCRRAPWRAVEAVRAICDRFVDGDEAVAELDRAGTFAVGLSRVVENKSCHGERAGYRLVPVVHGSFGGSRGRLTEKLVGSCSVPGVTSPLMLPKHLDEIDGVLTERFPSRLPWAAGSVVRLSASPGRRQADVACRESTPLMRCLSPPDEPALQRLRELGLSDGPRVLSLILQKHPTHR